MNMNFFITNKYIILKLCRVCNRVATEIDSVGSTKSPFLNNTEARDDVHLLNAMNDNLMAQVPNGT